MEELPKPSDQEQRPLEVDLSAAIEANRDRLMGSIAAGEAELASGKEPKSLEELLADPDFLNPEE